MPRLYRLVIMTLLTVSMLIPFTNAQAQGTPLCFDTPGITNCIEDRFKEFWEQNGGLPVFGYPITPATMERTADGTYLTQYFERNRFELHPEKARPYDVLLGRLGDDRLKQQNRDWRDFGPTKATPGCIFFQETSHNVCDLRGGIGFKTYWETNGLQDPALGNFQRSLALFGLPLSEAVAETNAAGDTVLTQWFERARFEYHLNKPPEFTILLGLLGSETRSAPAQPGSPLPPPSPNPFPGCDGIAQAENALASPNCVKSGKLVVVSVFGFPANVEISFTITSANGAAIGGTQTKQLGVNGFTTIDVDTSNYLGVALAPGDYVFVAQDTAGQNRRARAPFRVLP